MNCAYTSKQLTMAPLVMISLCIAASSFDRICLTDERLVLYATCHHDCKIKMGQGRVWVHVGTIEGAHYRGRTL